MLKFLTVFCISLSTLAADFQGWQGLRVLPVEGGLTASSIADVNGDGKESLFIANRRQSRIDIYNWLPKEKRVKADKTNRPNELLMAADFERKEIILERPPFDILLNNFDDDKDKELLVLTTLPLTLHLYDLKNESWELKESWKLPNFNLQSLSMLQYQNSIFISTANGVIIQKLEKNAAAEWLKPKEKGIRRFNWWVLDVDKDGQKDLVDLVLGSSDRAEFRWFKHSSGQFLPAIPLGEVRGTDARIDLSAKQPTFFFLNPIRNDTVNEYVLESGDATEFGVNRVLPILNFREEGRVALKIDGSNCLVEMDPVKPLMRVSKLTDSGFSELGKYPILRKTKRIIAPQGKSFLLMQVGESPNLYISKWEKGRFTYPELFDKGKGSSEKLLGMGMHASTVWWIKAVGDSLNLYQWQEGEDKPLMTEYKGIAKGLDQAFWLGGQDLMVKKKYAKDALFYRLKNNKAEVFQSSHLKDAVQSQFRFFNFEGKLTLSRIIDGIIQIYGDDLQPIDQIMLEDGLKIVDATMVNEKMLVLDQSGKKLHSLKKGSAGVMRADSSYDILQANSIKYEKSLGLILSNTKMLNAVKEGKPLKFKLRKSVDEKLGLPVGTKKADINSFYLLDACASKRNELLTVDYGRHQLTLIDISGKEAKSLASWKVYDDGKYPYSDGAQAGGGGANPFMIQTLDFDGDGIKEMVMACHDRILIYLGKEEAK